MIVLNTYEKEKQKALLKAGETAKNLIPYFDLGGLKISIKIDITNIQVDNGKKKTVNNINCTGTFATEMSILIKAIMNSIDKSMAESHLMCDADIIINLESKEEN